jgi:polyisoprenoid-binding protein YceI
MRLAFCIAIGAALASLSDAQPRSIDTEHSKMTVRVFKSGAFSAFGHDHEVTAPIASGTVDATARRVELKVRAASLRVADAKASDKDREQIQKTMLGPEVLGVDQHPEIEFRSTSAESSGGGAWTVQGNLTLHGRTAPVSVEVRENGGGYTGSARLKQSAFSIQPVKIAGGAVKVKDEVQIEFDIRLAR